MHPLRLSENRPREQRKIGDLLIAGKAVTAEQVREALMIQERHGGLTGRILIEMGACSAGDVRTALGRQVWFTTIDLARVSPQREAIGLLGKDVCVRFRMFPFEILEGLLCLAMVNVVSKNACMEAERLTKLDFKAFKVDRDSLMAAIARHYPEE